MLAILFERSNIPYHIYEQAAQVRPLGTYGRQPEDGQTSEKKAFNILILTLSLTTIILGVTKKQERL